MKVIIDTNVLISGIFFNGLPFEILRKWQQGKFDLIISPAIFEEYNRDARRLNKRYPDINIYPILRFIKNHSKSAHISKTVSNVCADLQDDKFFECAVNSDCTIIISGDKHLLDVSGVMNIDVFKPKEYIGNCL